MTIWKVMFCKYITRCKYLKWIRWKDPYLQIVFTSNLPHVNILYEFSIGRLNSCNTEIESIDEMLAIPLYLGHTCGILIFKLEVDFLVVLSPSIFTDGVVTLAPGALAGLLVETDRADTKFCNSGSSSEGGGVSLLECPFSLGVTGSASSGMETLRFIFTLSTDL